MNILVINSGSSSIKFKIFNMENENVISKGLIDGINQKNTLIKINNESWEEPINNYEDALNIILEKIDKSEIGAVGHRFVHGGSKYQESVIVNDSLLEELEELNDLAPLHNPYNLLGIKACAKLLSVPQVVVFDTSFHKDLLPEAKTYALPKDLIQKHDLKKFGFHGISHNYLMNKTKELLGKESVNIISCHLGNGCSVSCIKQNDSIDTSMGFSPLQGLVMGSRSGDIDPSLVLFLQEKLSVKNVNTILNKESGLKGLCGDSDMRKIHERVKVGDEDAILALKVFCHRITQYVGSYLGVMGEKTDALVFSGGIGEGAFYVRKNVCDSLKHLGIIIDDEKNNKDNGFIQEPSLISKDDSLVKVFVIPANEELMIAQHTSNLI